MSTRFCIEHSIKMRKMVLDKLKPEDEKHREMYEKNLKMYEQKLKTWRTNEIFN